MECKNRTTHWQEAASSALNFPFLREVSQNCFVFLMLSTSNIERMSCRIAALLMLSSSKIDEASQNYSYNYNYITLHYTTPIPLHCATLRYTTLTATTTSTTTRQLYTTLDDTTLDYTTAHNTTLNYATLITPHHSHNCNYAALITLQLQLQYATTTDTAALHHTTSSSCG